jgi:membrane-anchored glycerophosphoryl diester phosphodiesterase (GDPDase)
LFAAAIHNSSDSYREAFKRTFHCYLPLVAVTVAVSILLYLCLTVPAMLLPRGAPPLFRLVGWAAATSASLVVQALFLYAAPSILFDQRSVPGAVWDSIKLTKQYFMSTMSLVVGVFLITLPAVFLGFKSQFLARRLSPEVLPQIQVVSELIGFFSTLILVGGLTVLFYWRKFDEKKRP